MFASVTENASCVTDVVSMLSSLGFDASEQGARVELVIDSFDHWRNQVNGLSYGSCSASGLQIAA